MSRKYACDNCGKGFATARALGGHRSYCTGGKGDSVSLTGHSNRYTTEGSVSLTEVTEPSPVSTLTKPEVNALDQWWAGSTEKALTVVTPKYMQKGWMGLPWLMWGIVGGLGFLGMMDHFSKVRQPVGDGVKVPGLGATANFLPASAMALLGWLFISKLARTEFTGWIKAFDKWGK